LRGLNAGAAAYLPVAEAEYISGRLERALGLYRFAAEHADDEEVLTSALMGEGVVLARLGRYDQAAEAFRRAQASASPAQRRLAEASLGGVLVRAGKYEEGARVLRHALALTREAGDVAVEAQAQQNLGIALHHMGLLNEAIVAYRASLALKQEAPPFRKANSLLSLGEALRLTGRWEDAHQTLREAREIAYASGEYRALGYTYMNLGDLYLDAGWLEEAEDSYIKALEALEPSQDRYGTGLVQQGLGQIHALGGRPRQAWWRYERALENLKEGASLAELASVWINQAELLTGEEALALLRNAEAAAREVGARRVALQARLEALARTLPEVSRGEVEEAAAEVLQLEAVPLVLEPTYAPIWTSGRDSGEAGALVFEHLVHGWGTVRFYSLGQDRVVRTRQVEFFTRKEPWVLYALWLYGPQSAGELAARVFPEAKNPRKRVQIAVHHVREALGEDWIRFSGGLYRAAPLPGSWWDAAVLQNIRRAADKLPEWARGAPEEAARSLEKGAFLSGSPLSNAPGNNLYF